MKIRIKDYGYHIETFGNWFDLKATKDIYFQPPHLTGGGKIVFDNCKVPLNLSIELPKWYEAHLVTRPSLFKKKNLIQSNGVGIIDGPDNDNKGYIGDNDVVSCYLTAHAKSSIKAGERIAQFKVALSQKAPWYIKLKHLFTSGIQLEPVTIFGNADRSGYGSSNGYK